jgi:hypothetical protein
VGCGKRALTYRASDDAGVETVLPLSQAKQAPAVATSHAEAVAPSQLPQPYRGRPAAHLPEEDADNQSHCKLGAGDIRHSSHPAQGPNLV